MDLHPPLINDPAGQQPNDDRVVAVDLGAEWIIQLGAASHGHNKTYRTDDLRLAIRSESKATVKVTDLTINFYGERPPNHGFVEFLLEYIRTHLITLTLQFTPGYRGQMGGRSEKRFLWSAAESKTLHHLSLGTIHALPVHVLNEFCLANRNVKVFKMFNVKLNGGEATTGAELNLLNADASSGASPCKITILDHLILNDVVFMGQAAALEFADLVSRLKIPSLTLGRVVYYCTAGNEIIPSGVSSLFTESPVKRLVLRDDCGVATFRTALTAFKSRVEELSVDFDSNWNFGSIQREKANYLLTTAFCEFAKLNTLRLTFSTHLAIWPEIKKEFIRTLDACATLTEMQVNDTSNNFSPEELLLLHDGRTERNRNLLRFVANPADYPAKDLLRLILQLENCSTGLFLLAGALPKEFYIDHEGQQQNKISVQSPATEKLGYSKKYRWYSA